MSLLHQQALQQEHGEGAPRTADELTKVCDLTEDDVHYCYLVCDFALLVWWFREGDRSWTLLQTFAVTL